MLKIICIVSLLFHMICIFSETPTHKIETDNVIAAIKEKAQDPTKPGAVDDIVALYDKLKNLAPDVASTLSSYIDRLKNIFKSDTGPNKTIPKGVDPQNNTPPLNPQPLPATNEPTIKEKVIEKLDQTAEAIKQAATTSSTVIQQKGKELCAQLPTIDLKSAKEAVINKAIEIQQACSILATKFTEKDLVETQTKAMVTEIEQSEKKGAIKNNPVVQELCESVKQAAETFKQETADQWQKVKNTCMSLIENPAQKEEKPITVKQKPSTAIEPPVINPVSTKPSSIQTTGTNPFGTINSQQNPLLQDIKNPFLSQPASTLNQKLTSVEKVSGIAPVAIPSQPITTIKIPEKAIEKKGPEVKKATEKINDAPYLLVNTQLANLINTVNQLSAKQMSFTGSKPTYIINTELIKNIESVYDLYKKLSPEDTKIVLSQFTFLMNEYTTLLLKQINGIVPFVKDTLEKRINYLVLWLDINANLACQQEAPPKKQEKLSFNTFSGWLASKTEEASATIKKQAEAFKKEAETIICSDDELLFTQKDKEWQAVTTKAQVEKMIEEYQSSIAIIQKGIADPIEKLMKMDKK
ncbi:hypothetical protein EKK58_05140, partial [Candidatus Dependentiae bacterium]